jgi:hypothetical protein
LATEASIKQLSEESLSGIVHFESMARRPARRHTHFSGVRICASHIDAALPIGKETAHRRSFLWTNIDPDLVTLSPLFSSNRIAITGKEIGGNAPDDDGAKM